MIALAHAEFMAKLTPNLLLFKVLLVKNIETFFRDFFRLQD